MSKFLDKTGLDTLWAKIKSTFQTLGNKVTSIRDESNATDTAYPSEKAVRTELDKLLDRYDARYVRGTQDGDGWVKLAETGNFTTTNQRDKPFVWDVVIASCQNETSTEQICLNVRFNASGLPNVFFKRFYTIDRLNTHKFAVRVVGAAGSENGNIELWAYHEKAWGTIAIRESVASDSTVLTPTKLYGTYYSYYNYGGTSKPVADLENNIQVVDSTNVKLQTDENLVTSWSSTPSDSRYPSEKLVKYALDGKIPGTTLSASVPASSTRYIKMTVTEEAFHHYIVMLNARAGSEHAEWMFRTYGTGGNIGRTVINYIGAPVTDRKWFVAGATGQTYYIEYANPNTSAMSIKFSVCSIDNSELPTLEVVEAVPSGYEMVSIYGTAAQRLINARKLAVNLANNSTDSTFSGAADQTSIKVSGTLGIANGGTGATTKKAAEYAINGGMDQATAAMADNFQIVFSRVGSDQSATNGVFIYRTALTVWNYIKDKISSVLGLTETSYGGNAATATKATQDSDGNAINTTYLKQLYQAEYGVSTFADIYAAITSNKIVYCKVGGRMAFLAYLSVSNPPTSSSYVEFQYYRSNSAGTGDSVFVYKITNNNNTWTTTERPAYVVSDWNAASGSASYIANKPTIPAELPVKIEEIGGSAVDLDRLTASDMKVHYYTWSNGNRGNVSHKPTDAVYTVRVFPCGSGSAGTYVMQIAYQRGTTDVYIRRRNDGSTAWSSWTPFAFGDGNYPNMSVGEADTATTAQTANYAGEAEKTSKTVGTYGENGYRGIFAGYNSTGDNEGVVVQLADKRSDTSSATEITPQGMVTSGSVTATGGFHGNADSATTAQFAQESNRSAIADVATLASSLSDSKGPSGQTGYKNIFAGYNNSTSEYGIGIAKKESGGDKATEITADGISTTGSVTAGGVFVGNLSGNATTATSATYDDEGHKISSYYKGVYEMLPTISKNPLETAASGAHQQLSPYVGNSPHSYNLNKSIYMAVLNFVAMDFGGYDFSTVDLELRSFPFGDTQANPYGKLLSSVGVIVPKGNSTITVAIPFDLSNNILENKSFYPTLFGSFGSVIFGGAINGTHFYFSTPAI
jgi:hypothetical protein